VDHLRGWFLQLRSFWGSNPPWNTKARTSMLSRGAISAVFLPFMGKAVCGTVRPVNSTLYKSIENFLPGFMPASVSDCKNTQASFGHLIAQVGPPLFVRVVKLSILNNIVRIHKIARLKVCFGINGSWIAHCERPILDGSH
jgi:hypothetical protein